MDDDLDAVRRQIHRAGHHGGPLCVRDGCRPRTATVGVQQQVIGRREGGEIGGRLGTVSGGEHHTQDHGEPEDGAAEQHQRRQPEGRRTLVTAR
ncbi:hypothetical protein P3T36_004616 [Kitasatospora sp. MAP12-15]|nr:hypothetical protein [Kitasatospora sp. MAP12-44]